MSASSYSNAGYSLLAAVVEVASGRPFGEVLRSEVFLPAGMRHTGFLPDAADRARLAHGYTGDGDWGTSLDHPHAPDGPWWNLRGNGGILTTTGDFYRWHVALQGDAVLSKPEREKYQSPKVQEGRGEFPKYAYGWSVSRSPSGSRKLSHVGGNGVFQTDYRRYPEEGAVIAITSNTDDYSAIAVANQLEQRLFGKPAVELPATRPAVAAELRRCAGAYALASGERIEVAAEREPPGGHAGGARGADPPLGQAGRGAPAALRRARGKGRRRAGGGGARESRASRPDPRRLRRGREALARHRGRAGGRARGLDGGHDARHAQHRRPDREPRAPRLQARNPRARRGLVGHRPSIISRWAAPSGRRTSSPKDPPASSPTTSARERSRA